MNYMRDRKNALGFALSGLLQAFRKESHMKIHFVSAVIAIAVGCHFSIGRWEWIGIFSCIALVIITEIINTSIEKLCDMVTTEIHPTIKYIKDISAAAVLIACIFAVIAGALIFWPYLQ